MHNNVQLHLCHPATNDIVAEISDDKVQFHEENLKKVLNLVGIIIPEPMKEEFENKRTIYPKDKLFYKAFVDVYYPCCLKENGFILSKMLTSQE
ncbi:MAG: hypothetical protein ACH350_03675 [Parachlamydiaceae bacterium]